jgi:hypothetical protein
VGEYDEAEQREQEKGAVVAIDPEVRELAQGKNFAACTSQRVGHVGS